MSIYKYWDDWCILNLFEDLFNCIEKDTGEIFNFYHIHERGLGCIIADQHKGQALDKPNYSINSNYLYKY